MQEIDSNPDKRGDMPADVGLFGVDSEGKRHFWSRYYETIYVVDGADDVVQVEQDGARDRVPDWIAFVASRRGWRREWWADTAADAMRKTCEVA